MSFAPVLRDGQPILVKEEVGFSIRAPEENTRRGGRATGSVTGRFAKGLDEPAAPTSASVPPLLPQGGGEALWRPSGPPAPAS